MMGGATLDVLKSLDDLWPTSFNVAPDAGALALADLDGDGKQDVLVLSVGSYGASSWLEARVLPLSPFAQTVTYPVAGSAGGLVVADFDGDGRPDAAVPSPYDGSIRIYENRCP